MILYLKQKPITCMLVKLVPFSGVDGMRKFEVTHDVLREEFNNLLPCDVGERYCFHLLCEVVCDD